ncbi:MAG: glutamine--tRNA ligase, partial [Myxococcales bacterium]|nr:glutamine--tRNA ligase [Myxococcales bacterium]
KANSLVDMDQLDFCIRDRLNHEAPRVMCVVSPLKVVLTNFPEDEVQWLEASYWPHDVPKTGERMVPFTRELFIERDDFAVEPPKKWRRLSPGAEVRLRYGYIIRCDEVITDDSGEVVELRCSYDPDTKSGSGPSRKVQGTLHWVSASQSVSAEIRQYDRLFSVPLPASHPEKHFLEFLNPESLVVISDARIEPSVLDDTSDRRYQFERQGYYWRDKDSTHDKLVFNRIVPLRDSWAKHTDASAADAEPDAAAKVVAPSTPTTPAKPRSHERDQRRAENAALAAFYKRFQGYGLSEDDADILSGEEPLAEYFSAAVDAYDNPVALANWFVNELLRELKDRSLDDLPFTAPHFAELVRLKEDDVVSSNAAKEVLEVMVAEGGEPLAIVERLGLRQLTSESALEPVVAAVLEANPSNVAAYREGKTQLLGFFVGQVMKNTGGKADPKLTKSLIQAALDSATE